MELSREARSVWTRTFSFSPQGRQEPDAHTRFLNLLLRAVVERMIFAYKKLACTNRCYRPPRPVASASCSCPRNTTTDDDDCVVSSGGTGAQPNGSRGEQVSPLPPGRQKWTNTWLTYNTGVVLQAYRHPHPLTVHRCGAGLWSTSCSMRLVPKEPSSMKNRTRLSALETPPSPMSTRLKPACMYRILTEQGPNPTRSQHPSPSAIPPNFLTNYRPCPWPYPCTCPCPAPAPR
jgi:hypothetical protein